MDCRAPFTVVVKSCRDNQPIGHHRRSHESMVAKRCHPLHLGSSFSAINIAVIPGNRLNNSSVCKPCCDCHTASSTIHIQAPQRICRQRGTPGPVSHLFQQVLTTTCCSRYALYICAGIIDIYNQVVHGRSNRHSTSCKFHITTCRSHLYPCTPLYVSGIPGNLLLKKSCSNMPLQRGITDLRIQLPLPVKGDFAER
ncbi:hypothetical protein SDC9_122330 [bioreactor metagenome]|uniref:Uncharacterized protein n=1 Tax=bioreactor metagenome TaxID=1076179 RepID=A0A645CEK5_9ZZZZ